MGAALHNHSDVDAPLAGAAMRCASTCDIDEQAALLRGWNQTYSQMSAGSFSGSFVEAELGKADLFREITSSSLHQTGVLPKGACAIGVPVRLAGSATFCGQACDGTQLHVFSGSSGFEFYSPSGLDIVGVVIEQEDFEAALCDFELDRLAEPLAEAHLRKSAPADTARLRKLVLDGFEAMQNVPCPAGRLKIAPAIAADVMSGLMQALACCDTGGEMRIPPLKRWDVVRRARQLVAELPHELVSVEFICSELGISRRALQYCFQDTLGLAPAAYLRAVRFNRARRAIKEGSSVTEAATLCGFWHFGRFSRDFRAMFGELPSETARRVGVAPRLAEPSAAAQA